MRIRAPFLHSLALVVLGTSTTMCVWASEKTPAERGREIIFHQSLNPAVWSMAAYDNLWKTWGLTEKPANYIEAVKARYGLSSAPFDNNGLPMGLMHGKRLLGKGIVNNCLLCHGGTVAGQTIADL